jgi:nicotinamide-nucleotide amidase
MSEKPLEELAGELLRQRGLRLAIAESCTGGLLGHRITNIPGSSTYYMGSVTAYAYEAKVRLLGVHWETLELHGAVSEETVLEMAKGVREVLAADVGLAVSGIAGPGGGTREKPVGLTWIGLSCEGLRKEGFQKAWKNIWQGNRLQIKEQSAEHALELLVNHLQESEKRRAAQAIEVTARFDPSGMAEPLNFKHGDRLVNISDSGRRWEDAAGKHVLVMDHANQVYELLYIPAENRWYLNQAPAKKI